MRESTHEKMGANAGIFMELLPLDLLLILPMDRCKGARDWFPAVPVPN